MENNGVYKMSKAARNFYISYFCFKLLLWESFPESRVQNSSYILGGVHKVSIWPILSKFCGSGVQIDRQIRV